MHHTEVIVLAAGKGTRMGGDRPKVLTDLAGKPLISHVLAALEQLPLTHSPLIVVGYKADEVRSALDAHGGAQRYAHQTEQRGTGHAVREALPHVQNDSKRIVVLYGDQPLLNSSSVQRLIALHEESHAQSNAPLVMATVTVDDFTDWKTGFYDFGRIMRNENGAITGIIEKKDASDTQRDIHEVNPGYYSFDIEWIRNHINNLTAANASGEFYLTDLVGIAVNEGHTIPSISVEPHEALGVNTPEQLEVVKRFVKNF